MTLTGIHVLQTSVPSAIGESCCRILVNTVASALEFQKKKEKCNHKMKANNSLRKKNYISKFHRQESAQQLSSIRICCGPPVTYTVMMFGVVSSVKDLYWK